jgi:very-short-patch-repair endonuclease
VALKNAVWSLPREEVRNLLARGHQFVEVLGTIGKPLPGIWEKDFESIRARLATAGSSLFRIFSSEYRKAVGELRAAVTVTVSGNYDERMALLTVLAQGTALRNEIRSLGPVGSSAFGNHWDEENSNWNLLADITNWVEELDAIDAGSAFREAYLEIDDLEGVEALAKDCRLQITLFRSATEALMSELNLGLFAAFGVSDIAEIDLGEMKARSDLWLASMEQLPDWVTYNALADRIRAAGAGSFLSAIDSGILAADKLIPAFEWQLNSELLREVVKRYPELGTFDGLVHGRKVDEFKNADRERLEISKLRTLVAHYEQMPKQGDGVGVVGVIRGEMARKRGHMPLRKLISQTSQAIQGLKPIFMMSPLSVAQYLVPGDVEFDLLVIDEASQVEPVDALGAVARCKQVVVVGDSKQLPPSTFFSKMTSDSDEDAEEFEGSETGASAKDIESVLSLCTARGIPSKMLQWHYRSRHHSLIAASNHEFYNDGLFIVPSPHAVSEGLGLKFRYVDGGVFDSGKTAVNRLEAATVAKAAMEHAKKHPDLTLGVAAFSIRQKEAILAELELLRQRSPGTEKFFYSHPNEPFFVKNLENVQGDERDVIFISIGYARNESGYFAMKFGPLSVDGGERRLNVLISRAKIRCEVYSSIRSEDIDLNRAKGRGVASLKSFLRYAETGQIGVARASGEPEDSPFEEAVRSEVEKNGYTVDCQVGEAGFFIDLAVRNPDTPGSYVMGIECDGAAYHSSRSARDRDRLRQAVLEDHGWVLHRIWSTDWFQRPEREIRNVLLAIEKAREASKQGTTAPQKTKPVAEAITREPDEPKDDPAAVPYQMASIVGPTGSCDLPTMYPGQVVRYVLQVLETEAPISLDEVVVRIRSAFGYERAGNRLHTLIERAARLAIKDTAFVNDGGFFENRAKPVVPRRRGENVPLSLRKPENLPPAEIRAAIVIVVERNLGVSGEQIATAVARLFGFKATSSQLKTLIDGQVERLIETGILVNRNGLIQRASSALPGTLDKSL